MPMRIELSIDSSAARSAVSRLGVGRMRAMEIRVFWIQRMVKRGRVVVRKVLGTDNVADVGTKPLARDPFTRFRDELGLKLRA